VRLSNCSVRAIGLTTPSTAETVSGESAPRGLQIDANVTGTCSMRPDRGHCRVTTLAHVSSVVSPSSAALCNGTPSLTAHSMKAWGKILDPTSSSGVSHLDPFRLLQRIDRLRFASSQTLAWPSPRVLISPSTALPSSAVTAPSVTPLSSRTALLRRHMSSPTTLD
jgi:hypothetical protein